MSSSNGKGRVLGYCRASTAKQELSPEAQKRIITERAQALGYPEPIWYVDPEQSGGLDILERPAGRRMMADAHKGDTIIVAKLDRLSRDVRDLTITVDMLIKSEVALFLCDYGLVDFASPSGRCFVQMMSVFAEFERRIIAARTRDVLAHLKATGQAYCRSAQYGFKFATVVRRGQKVRVQVPDPKERWLMGQLVAWVDSGWSYDTIRDHLTYSHFDGQRGYPNINKQTGQEQTRDWSKTKIFRMVQAERKLRLRERVSTSIVESN